MREVVPNSGGGDEARDVAAFPLIANEDVRQAQVDALAAESGLIEVKAGGA